MLSQGLLKTTHRKEVSAVSPTPRLPSSSCHTTGTVSCLALMVDTLIRRVSWHELIARLGIGTFKLLNAIDNTHWLTELIPQSLVKIKDRRRRRSVSEIHRTSVSEFWWSMETIKWFVTTNGTAEIQVRKWKGGRGALHRIMFPPLKKPHEINSSTTKY